MASGGKAMRSCLGWPGCPPMRRLSWPCDGGGLGGLTMSEDGGLDEVEESFARRGELLAQLGDDLLEGGEFRLQDVDSRLEPTAVGTADRVLGSHGGLFYIPADKGSTPVNGHLASIRDATRQLDRVVELAIADGGERVRRQPAGLLVPQTPLRLVRAVCLACRDGPRLRCRERFE